jgi:hypothetical protein
MHPQSNPFMGFCPRCGYEPAIERFWSHVDQISTPDGCWLWTEKLDRYGYGRLWFRGRTTTAHKTAWILTNGEIPEGLCVCHTCDVRACCNPSHLWLGTQSENTLDRHRKGRTSRHARPVFHGEEHGMAKLTEAQVREIRARYVKGVVTARFLAAEYGVTHNQILFIVRRTSWKHLD